MHGAGVNLVMPTAQAAPGGAPGCTRKRRRCAQPPFVSFVPSSQAGTSRGGVRRCELSGVSRAPTRLLAALGDERHQRGGLDRLRRLVNHHHVEPAGHTRTHAHTRTDATRPRPCWLVRPPATRLLAAPRCAWRGKSAGRAREERAVARDAGRARASVAPTALAPSNVREGVAAWGGWRALRGGCSRPKEHVAHLRVSRAKMLDPAKESVEHTTLASSRMAIRMRSRSMRLLSAPLPLTAPSFAHTHTHTHTHSGDAFAPVHEVGPRALVLRAASAFGHARTQHHQHQAPSAPHPPPHPPQQPGCAPSEAGKRPQATQEAGRARRGRRAVRTLRGGLVAAARASPPSPRLRACVRAGGWRDAPRRRAVSPRWRPATRP